MSFEGQVLCQRMAIGPCALTMPGAATVAAPVAPAASRNRRRVAVLDVRDCSADIEITSLVFLAASGSRSRLEPLAWLVFQRRWGSLVSLKLLHMRRIDTVCPQFARTTRKAAGKQFSRNPARRWRP